MHKNDFLFVFFLNRCYGWNCLLKKSLESLFVYMWKLRGFYLCIKSARRANDCHDVSLLQAHKRHQQIGPLKATMGFKEQVTCPERQSARRTLPKVTVGRYAQYKGMVGMSRAASLGRKAAATRCSLRVRTVPGESCS